MLCYPYPHDIQGCRNQKKTEKFKLRNIVLEDVYGNQCTDVQKTEMSLYTKARIRITGSIYISVSGISIYIY